MLKFSSVSKTYNENIVAVDNVSLDIPKGEFCVILGPSGAGKSTLLRLANGMSMPKEGSVEFDGKKVNKKNPKVAVLIKNTTRNSGLQFERSSSWNFVKNIYNQYQLFIEFFKYLKLGFLFPKSQLTMARVCPLAKHCHQQV